MYKNKHSQIVPFGLFWLLFILIAVSCKNEEENKIVIESFPQKISLVSESIDKVSTYDPRDILIVDSLLIILNKQGDYFLQYYNVNNFKLIGEYGNEGRGPGEFIYPELVGQSIIKENDKIILKLFDWKRLNINYIDIQESIKDKNYICKYEKLDNRLITAAGILFDNDSLICIIPDLDEYSGRFIFFDKKEKNIKYIPFIPKPINNIHKNNLYTVFATSGKGVLEQEKIFVAMPASMGQLDYFDFNGNYLKSIVFDKNEYLEKASLARDVQTIDGFKIYSSKIKIVNNYIYVLLNVYIMPPQKPKSKILQFSKEGKALKEYILDKEIWSFDVDTVHNRFIGFCPNEEKSQILQLKY